MRRVLIWLSGAHQEVLDLCPSERPKYEGIGGVVLTTSVMAGISCAFALRLALNVWIPVCVVAGLLWGLAIMNLDRWLISATPRRDTWWKNGLQLFPRFLLALIIGVVVSTPLVMQVFNPEISQQLEKIQQREQDEFNKKLTSQYDDLPALRQRVLDYEAVLAPGATTELPVVLNHPKTVAAERALQNARNARDTARKQYDTNPTPANQSRLNDAQGTLNGKTTTYQRVQRAVLAELQATAKANIEDARQEYQDELNRRNTAASQFTSSNERSTGLLARLEALRELTASNATLQRAYLTLLLFITTIEILPVLVKFLMSLGTPNAYERALARFEKTKLRQADMRLEDAEKEAEMEFKTKAKDREEMARLKEEIDEQRRQAWRDEQLNRTTKRRRNPTSTYGRM